MEIGDVIRMISIYGGGALVLAVLGVIFLPKIFGKKKNEKRQDPKRNGDVEVDVELSELETAARKATLERNIGARKRAAMSDLLVAAEAERDRVDIEIDILPNQIAEADGKRKIAKLRKEEKSLNRPLFVKAMMVAAPAAIILFIFVGICFFAKANGWN